MKACCQLIGTCFQRKIIFQPVCLCIAVPASLIFVRHIRIRRRCSLFKDACRSSPAGLRGIYLIRHCIFQCTSGQARYQVKGFGFFACVTAGIHKVNQIISLLRDNLDLCADCYAAFFCGSGNHHRLIRFQTQIFRIPVYFFFGRRTACSCTGDFLRQIWNTVRIGCHIDLIHAYHLVCCIVWKEVNGIQYQFAGFYDNLYLMCPVCETILYICRTMFAAAFNSHIGGHFCSVYFHIQNGLTVIFTDQGKTAAIHPEAEG